MTQYLKIRDRMKIESFNRIGEDVVMGEVVIDLDKCKGCAYCTKCCAAAAIEVVDKKARMVTVSPMCMSCGDCVAICPEGAIELKQFIQFKHYFRYLDRGEPLPPRRF